MESCSSDNAVVEPSATYSLVLFHDIPHSYPPSTQVTCRYTLTAAFQPNTRDWVGVFKVGWSSTKDYHTFVWVEPCLDVVSEEVKKQVVFNDYYLPKDDSEFYQFCYVDSSGQVRGASTPFCFKNPEEPSVDCSLETDLLVITTQEQVEQSARERDELQKEVDQIRVQNESIKAALMEKQREVEQLKEQQEGTEQERKELAQELSQMKKQNESLRSSLREQQQELDCVKAHQEAHQLEQQNSREEEKLSQSVKSVDESQREQEVKQEYDRAVVKITQLKQEQERLYGTIDNQNAEIAELKSKLREKEQEPLKLKDDIQLLQVDLQSSEKEKQRLHVELRRLDELTQNLEELKRENEELRTSRQMLQNIPDEDMKVQYETILNQLQDTRSQLSNERHLTNSSQRRMEQLERELVDTKEQLQSLASSTEQLKCYKNKLELQLAEAHGAIAEKNEYTVEMDSRIMIERQEKEDLESQNQVLKRDIERLRSELAEQMMASTADSLYAQPSSPHVLSPETITTSSQEQQQDTLPESLQYDATLFESIGTSVDTEQEETFVCPHCQETFPGLTREEKVQHEQSHQVCPFCTLICDSMEQSVFEDHVYSHEL